MNYDSIPIFPSKRNHVYLAHDSAQHPVVVKDFGSSVECYNQELRVARILYEHGVAVPEILQAADNRIIYTYLQGSLAVELLECAELQGETSTITTTFDNICLWLQNCYTTLWKAFGCEMILGDAHLRNFIQGDRLYGVDFECVAPGRRETDIAGLAAFAVTYDPAYTPIKYQMAALLCCRCIQLMSLDTALLRHEMTSQLDMIAKRRKIILPDSIIPELWRRIEAI